MYSYIAKCGSLFRGAECAACSNATATLVGWLRIVHLSPALFKVHQHWFLIRYNRGSRGVGCIPPPPLFHPTKVSISLSKLWKMNLKTSYYSDRTIHSNTEIHAVSSSDATRNAIGKHKNFMTSNDLLKVHYQNLAWTNGVQFHPRMLFNIHAV